MPFFYKIECKSNSIEIEVDERRNVIVHGMDVEAERSLAELGFEPHPCLVALDDHLLRSAANNLHAIFDILVKAGGDTHKENERLLRVSAANGYYFIVKTLIDHGADVHATDDDALWLAATSGHADIVSLLLDHGATPERWIQELLIAVHRDGYDDVVKILKDWIRKHE